MNQSWKFMLADYHCIMFHKDQLEELKQWDVSGTTLWLFKDYCEMFVRDIKCKRIIYVPSVADPHSPLHEQNLFGMISSDLAENSYADMTGHYALEVALYMRCNPIYLIGYDLYGKHFCKDKHGAVDYEWQEIQVDMWEETASQVDFDFGKFSIYNISPDSRIQGFPKVTLEEVFDGI